VSIPEHLELVTVQRMKLTIKMDATVTVYDASGQPTDWLKPGSEAAVSWNGVPTQEELMLRFNDLTTVTSATLESVLVEVRKKLDAVRRGER
jgi:hypothetical protein